MALYADREITRVAERNGARLHRNYNGGGWRYGNPADALQAAAYEVLMGRPPVNRYAPGTLGHAQWAYRGNGDVLALTAVHEALVAV